MREDGQENPLEDIKNLLILQLIKDGATYEEIASVLGVSHMTIRRLMSRVKRPENRK